MIANKKISVIIPNFNYARYLGQAIESVLNQSYTNIELIVVNNGSTDNSMAMLERYRDRIILIDQPNLGQSGARNSGLSHATGAFIAFLDADDYWMPDKLKKQFELLTDTTQLIYCGISQFRDPGPSDPTITLPAYRGDCRHFFVDQPGVSIVLSGESTALFSIDLLNRVGSFDSELNSAAGWDFFRRCSQYTNFNFVNEPLTNYRLHGANMSNSSHNTIPDIRRAYAKLFADEEWAVPKRTETYVLMALELTYLKTHLKTHDLGLASSSARNLIRLISKSFGHLLRVL